ncbi:Protein sof1, variant 2 [Entomophthora muscae]|uniref:Protein sof1, variant 2 n=1 Tax=Entomophthora muscae TaxID=34485 RepID=A0ACC2SGW8_9FUNG|nr:Protein sof1, variant 2 [Entomophthora muscae]
MKVKAITRSDDDYKRDRKSDVHKIQRNYDPVLHPFEREREYTRALNATKLERMFAKPFLAALNGHSDSVYCMAKHAKDLQLVVSGSGDGELRAWRINERNCFWNTAGHRGTVKGVCIMPNTSQFISVGVDKIAKIWTMSESRQPAYTYHGKGAFTGVDHHRSDPLFATSGSVIDLWDVNRSEPINTFEWGADTINAVKFNQTETNIIASCGTDRAIALYDIRTRTPLHKLFLQFHSNALSWNPMEAYNFVVANEDHNCYQFDMRNFSKAVVAYTDHVSAVMDIDFSPTGDQFVTGSYDRTVRIYNTKSPKSKDAYHTKRMQRVFAVKFTMDSKYVLSGSDDTNIRLWKADASERLGVRNNRERTYLAYSEKLKEKYAHLPEIRRISKHRFLPTDIKKATATKGVMLESRRIKELNRLNNQKKIRNPKMATKNAKKALPEQKPKSLKQKIILRSET